jgi:hypothetical protein
MRAALQKTGRNCERDDFSQFASSIIHISDRERKPINVICPNETRTQFSRKESKLTLNALIKS